MPFIVKEADIRKDRNIMLNILKNNRSLSDFSYEKRYDWTYLNNPDGNATAWIIWDEKNLIPVGFTAVFPRRMLVNGKEQICWNCGDFSIEPKYRTLGVAVQLRKEAKKGVENGKAVFLYAHPNNRMKVVHLRAGHHEVGLMHRYALPLRMEVYLQSRLKSRLISKILAFPTNQFIKFYFVFRSRNNRLTSAYHAIPNFTDAHESLHVQLSEIFPIIGVRDKKYLKWKYIDNPNHKYSLMNFFVKRQLVGYVVFSYHEHIINVVDCIVFPEDYLRDVIVQFVRKIFKIFPLTRSVSVVTFESNPLVNILKQLKFQYRDDATTSVIAYANAVSDMDSFFYQKENWFLSVGDRDA